MWFTALVAGQLLILAWKQGGSTNLTQALSIGGGLGIPFGCWIMPALILRQAGRQRPGPVPGSWPLADHPIVTSTLLSIGLLVLLMFGLLVWTWWPIKIFTVGLALGLAIWILWFQPRCRA